MKVFLKTHHIGDDESDYRSFSNLDICISYMKDLDIEADDYQITSYPELPEDDYEFIR